MTPWHISIAPSFLRAFCKSIKCALAAFKNPFLHFCGPSSIESLILCSESVTITARDEFFTRSTKKQTSCVTEANPVSMAGGFLTGPKVLQHCA
jgi:hypothetical protein